MPRKKKDKTSKEKLMPVIEEVVGNGVVSDAETQIVDAEIAEQNTQPQQVVKKKKGFNFKLLLFLTIITATLTGLLVGGFYVYFTGISNLKPKGEEKANYPTPVAVVTPAPASSPSVVEEEAKPEENVDVSLYKIQVLNGSGKIGEASKMEKILVAADYKVVSVGNASSYKYKQSVVAYKKDVPPVVISNLKDLLSKAYDMSEEDGDNLPDSGSYDISITVGSQ